jgi:two-component sensor histidine kinase
MISAKLLHAVKNRLQMVMGYVDLAEAEPDDAKRTKMFERARTEIRDLTKFLEQKQRGKVP